MTATFKISAFGDEIDADLETQLTVLNQLDIAYLDLRGAWDKNVLHMEDDDLVQVNALCAAHNISIACLGSPIGKSPIEKPIDYELNNLRQMMHIGELVNCHRVRVFSFYPPDRHDNAHHDDYVDESVARLIKLAELAGSGGFKLYLENEAGIVTDTLARSQAVIEAVRSPHLQFLWDSANFIREHEENVVERGWPLLGQYVGFIHLKDAVLSDGRMVTAGEGDGQIDILLQKLMARGYQGFLTLEPHLKIAGHSTGHSSADGMTIAAKALRKVMAEVGAVEVK